jgi:hypothetical protein
MHRNLIIWVSAVVLGLALAVFIGRIASHLDRHANYSHQDKKPTNSFSPEFVKSTVVKPDVVRAATRPPIEDRLPDAPLTENQQNRRVQREINGLRQEYRRFLSTTQLSPENQLALLELGAKRALLALERSEKIERGEYKSIAEVDAYYKTESDRLDQEMKRLLRSEYPAFWDATEKIPLQRQYNIYATLVKRHDTPIPQDQLDTLVDIGWEYYKAAGVDLFFSPEYSRVHSGEVFTDQMVKRSTADSLIRKDAAAFLTASQLGKLQSFQSEQIQGMYTRSKLPQKKT